MLSRLDFYGFHSSVAAIYLNGNVQKMRFQKLILSDLDFPVFYYSFEFLSDGGKVRTLKNVVGMESRFIQILYQVLNRITVVSHLKRTYFVLS